jgi:hypothetical protein
MAKILKNTTGSPIVINDVGRVSLPASPGTYTIPPQDYDLWGASVGIQSYVNAGTVVVNDGFDDLKPVNGLRHLQEEGVPRHSSLLATGSVLATTNSTLTLTASSRLVYIFTGTTAGQIVRLPNATTLNIVHRYEIWNTSTQTVTVQNNAGTNLFSMAAAQKTWITLQDNSTANGIWLFEANFLGGTGGGNGIAGFGFDGNASPTRWLEGFTNVPTNITPYIVAGSKSIRAISFGTSANSTATATIYKNGVLLDTIATAATKKVVKLNLNHLLVNLDELSCAITAGSCTRPVVLIWL